MRGTESSSTIGFHKSQVYPLAQTVAGPAKPLNVEAVATPVLKFEATAPEVTAIMAPDAAASG